MPDFVAGVDLGATHIQIGIVTGRDHELIARTRAETRAGEGSDCVMDRIAQSVREACNSAGLASASDLSALGIGAPSPVDPEKGIVLDAVNLRWRKVALADELSDRLDGIPVVVDNDVNVAIWGEYRMGAAQSAVNCLGLWVGTGIGGGLVLDGRLFHGTFGTAGEFGQTIIYPGTGPAYCKVEHHGSRTFIVDNLIRLMRANRTTILSELVSDELENLTIAHVAKALEADDELAIEVTRHAADVLGIAAANAVTLLSLDMVVLGGGVVEALGARYLSWMRASFDRAVFPEQLRQCKLVETKLKDNAGLLGAALLARQRVGGH